MTRDRASLRPTHHHAHLLGLWLLAALLLAVALVQPAEAVIALQDVPPSVTSVEGAVEVSSDAGNTWTPAEPGTRVSSEHLLRTGDDGTCVLAFSDYAVVALKPGTTVTMLPHDRQLRLEITAGWIWVQFDALQAGNRDAVLAPRALAAAIGPSMFTMEFDRDGGTIKIIDGDVDVRSDTGDFMTTLAAGESLIITPNASSIPYKFNVEAEQAAWEPVFAGMTTTSLPGETTTTGGGTRTTAARTTSTQAGTTRTSRPHDDLGSGGLSRPGISLVVGAAALFLALLAAATVLAVLLIRRNKQPNIAGAPPVQPPVAGSAQAAHPPAPPAASSVFCRFCGAPLSQSGQFCRACGKKIGA